MNVKEVWCYCYIFVIEINQQADKENDRNKIITNLKNEFDDKLNQYKSSTQKKLIQLLKAHKNKENSKPQELLNEIMLTGDLDDSFIEMEIENDEVMSPKEFGKDTNANLLTYVKQNSFLKQSNYFLEKEKDNLLKEIDKLSAICEKYEEKLQEKQKEVNALENKLKEKEQVISRYQVEDIVQNRIDTESRLNMSMPYAMNYAIKPQRDEGFKMQKKDLKDLVNLISHTQSRKRAKTNTGRFTNRPAYM